MNWRSLFFETEGDKKSFYLSLFICIAYIFPFIISDFYYIDDLGRAVNGEPAWEGLGRPLSNWVMRAMSFNGALLADVSPMPQILSAIVLAFTIYLCSKTFFTENRLVNILIISPLILNPLYLQNISFQYDSFPMTLGVCLSVVAYIITKNGTIYNYLLSVFLLFSSLCLYQPSTNVYIGFLAIGIIFDAFYNRNFIQTFFLRCCTFIGSYIIYMMTIPLLFVANNRGEVVDLSIDGFFQVVSNMESSFALLQSLMGLRYSILFYPLILFMFITPLFIVIKRGNPFYSINSFLVAALILSSPIIAWASYFGPLSLLKSTFYEPRAFTGLGTVLIFSLFSMHVFIKLMPREALLQIFFVSYVCLLVIFAFSLCFAYINAMQSQVEHDKSIMSLVLHDIVSNDTVSKFSAIKVAGVTGYDGVHYSNKRVFPVIGFITSRYNGWLGSEHLKRFGLNNVRFTWYRDKERAERQEVCEADAKPIVSNQFYAIYVFNDVTYVWLKGDGDMCVPPHSS